MPPSIRMSLSELRAQARKLTITGDPEYITAHDRFMANYIGPPVACIFLFLGFSANAVTAFSIILGVSGGACLPSAARSPILPQSS
jgi:hypothetical protein